MQAETGWAEAEAMWGFINSVQHKRIHRALYHAAYVTRLGLPTEKCYNYRADNQSGTQCGGGQNKFHANDVK